MRRRRRNVEAVLAAVLYGAVGLAGCGSGQTPQQRRAAALVKQLRDHKPERRIEAARQLGEMKHRPAVGELIHLLYDIRPDVRLAAIQSLGQIADPASAEELSKALAAPEWAHRKSAAEALGSIADAKTVPVLIAALGDADITVGKAAAKALSQIGPPSVESLIAVLTRGPDRARPHAAYALGLLRDPRAKAPLRAALAEANAAAAKVTDEIEAKRAKLPDVARIERDIESVRKKLAELPDKQMSDERRKKDEQRYRQELGSRQAALAAANGLRAEIASLAAKRGPAQMLRLSCVEALIALGDANDLPAIVGMLGDRDASVVTGVREQLVGVGQAAVAPLVAAAGDRDPAVRLAAVMTLVDIGNQEGVEALLAAMDDDDRDVQDAAYGFFHVVQKGKRDRPRVQVLRKMSPQLMVALKHGKDSVRLRAARLLDKVAGPETVDCLLAALKDPYGPVKLQAVATLSRLGDRRAVDGLAELLKQPDETVKFAAAEALAGMGDPRAVDVMLAYVKENYPGLHVKKTDSKGRTKWEYRDRKVAARMRVAVAALARSGDKRVVPPLVEMLKCPDPDFLTDVVRAVRQVGDERAYDALLPLLDRTSWPERAIRVHAIHAVARIGGPKAVKPLIAQLTREDFQEPQHRADLCRVLGDIGDPNAVDVLANYLTWDLEEVRSDAKDALVKIGPPAVGKLIARLDNEDRTFRAAVSMVLALIGKPAVDAAIAGLKARGVHVREGCAWTLGQIGEPRAVAPLLAAIQSEPSPAVRCSAAWALGRLGDASAVERLIEVLAADANERCRRGAAQALGRIADKRALDPLVAALEDGDPGVRSMAAAALGAIGDARALAPLEAVFKGDKVVEVRAAANDAVITIRSTGGGSG